MRALVITAVGLSLAACGKLSPRAQAMEDFSHTLSPVCVVGEDNEIDRAPDGSYWLHYGPVRAIDGWQYQWPIRMDPSADIQKDCGK